MSITLTPELERFVKERVEGGRYASAEEVVREGLRLLHEAEQLREMDIEELRRKVAVGLEEARTGKVVEGEEVFAKIKGKSHREHRGHGGEGDGTADPTAKATPRRVNAGERGWEWRTSARPTRRG